MTKEEETRLAALTKSMSCASSGDDIMALQREEIEKKLRDLETLLRRQNERRTQQLNEFFEMLEHKFIADKGKMSFHLFLVISHKEIVVD